MTELRHECALLVREWIAGRWELLAMQIAFRLPERIAYWAAVRWAGKERR